MKKKFIKTIRRQSTIQARGKASRFFHNITIIFIIPARMLFRTEKKKQRALMMVQFEWQL